MATLDELRAAGELDGYREGLPMPGPLALVNGPAVDDEVCRDARCRGCGRTGLECRFFVPQEEGLSGYRSFAVCPDCGTAEEF